jgi:hypothetical protein
MLHLSSPYDESILSPKAIGSALQGFDGNDNQPIMVCKSFSPN